MPTSYPTQRRRFALAAAVEATYGTDEVPTFAADAIRLTEPPTVKEDALAMNTREGWSTGGLGTLAMASKSGLLHVVDAKSVLQGAGSAYASGNLPPIDPILKAAGFAATVDATPGSETVTYDVSDDASTGISIYTEVDGNKYATVGGVVEKLQVAADAGQFVTAPATIRGIASAITEQVLESATYPSGLPPVWKASSFTLGAFTPVARSFQLDLGLKVAARGDGNATSAFAGYRITERMPTLQVTVEKEALSTWDPWDDWENSTQRSFALTVGSVQYNKFTISADDARIQDVESQDQDGLSVVQVTYGLFTPSSGNELRIVFA